MLQWQIPSAGPTSDHRLSNFSIRNARSFFRVFPVFCVFRSLQNVRTRVEMTLKHACCVSYFDFSSAVSGLLLKSFLISSSVAENFLDLAHVNNIMQLNCDREIVWNKVSTINCSPVCYSRICISVSTNTRKNVLL